LFRTAIGVPGNVQTKAKALLVGKWIFQDFEYIGDPASVPEERREKDRQSIKGTIITLLSITNIQRSKKPGYRPITGVALIRYSLMIK